MPTPNQPLDRRRGTEAPCFAAVFASAPVNGIALGTHRIPV